jgi:hypothetical protein
MDRRYSQPPTKGRHLGSGSSRIRYDSLLPLSGRCTTQRDISKICALVNSNKCEVAFFTDWIALELRQPAWDCEHPITRPSFSITCDGHSDAAPDPVGPLELSMRRSRSTDALMRFRQPWDDAAGGEVDVQVHQFLGRGALAAR